MRIFIDQLRRINLAGCCVVLAMSVAGWTTAATSASAALRADYQFQNTLASSFGAPPTLTTVGSGTNSFATESVNGPSQTVLTFPAENGVQLAPTTGVIPNDNYTLVVLFRFAQITNRPWQRIVDFQNSTSDRGLYAHQGTLELYPYAKGATATIKAEEYVLVALTRDSAGTVTGYVDGTKQFSYDDSSTDAAVIDANNGFASSATTKVGALQERARRAPWRASNYTTKHSLPSRWPACPPPHQSKQEPRARAWEACGSPLRNLARSVHLRRS